MEENVHLKGLILGVMIVLFSLALLIKETTSKTTFKEENALEIKLNALLEENNDKELLTKKEYENGFVYLAFQKDTDFFSYVLDAKTGEEKDFSALLKEDRVNDFLVKEKELLFLKYPDFVVQALLKEDVKRDYQILESELVIFYSNVSLEPSLEKNPYLRINYQEIKDILNIPVQYDNEYELENGYQYDKNKKTIAFTFDDGPSGENTNRLVQILEKNKAHATFFMVGNKMQAQSSVLLNVLNHGNEIGSHSYSHKNMARQKKASLIEDLDKTKEIYNRITGKEIVYTRPPYGAITQDIKATIDTIFITWNIDTEDWLHHDSKYVSDYILENVEDGDIVLMHDLYETTIDAVEDVLPKLYAKGFQVVSVSELADLRGRTMEAHSLYRSLKKVE